jgi:hypothetical protein
MLKIFVIKLQFYVNQTISILLFLVNVSQTITVYDNF